MWRERITWCGPLPILWTRSSSLAARSGTPLPTQQRLCQVQEVDLIEFFYMMPANILVVFAKVETNLSSRTLEKVLAEFQTGTQ